MDTCSALMWEMLLARGGRGVPAGGPSPTVGCSMSVISTDDGGQDGSQSCQAGYSLAATVSVRADVGS